MKPLDLVTVADGVPSLRAILVTTLPDCLLFDSFLVTQTARNLQLEGAAAFFGELVRVNQETLNLLGSRSLDARFLVETDELLYSVWGRDKHFALGFVFEPNLPLGMLRHYVQRMSQDLDEQLRQFDRGQAVTTTAEAQPARGVQLLEYLQLYAPDPHASMFRIALKTGIPLDDLERPNELDEEHLVRVEQAVCDILGIDQLDF